MRPGICRDGVLLSRTVFPGRSDLLRLCFGLQYDCRLYSFSFLPLCKIRSLSSTLAVSSLSCHRLMKGVCVGVDF